jgi:hypothetical protein
MRFDHAIAFATLAAANPGRVLPLPLGADSYRVGGTGGRVRCEVTYKAAEQEHRVAYAEVYVPGDLDAHGEAMLKEDVQAACWDFGLRGLNSKIDVDHDNRAGRATAVESFLTRKGDPDFPVEGTWVVGAKFHDAGLWRSVKMGEKAGWSLEADVIRRPMRVSLIGAIGRALGQTFASKGDGIPEHTHRLVVERDRLGNVVGGRTDTVHGHRHVIRGNLKTESAGGHLHTFHLPARVVPRAA